LINLLKTQASLFQKINGYTWFLDVEQPQEIVEFLESININPHHSPTIIKTADADGFYDSIQHFWLTKIYRKEIPILFKQSNASFLQINTQHKSYKWIQQWRKQTPTIHILSPKKLIKYLTWSLRNQYILVGNQLYKQVIGVGQGLSHSGHQSRFASIISERNFILSQKSKNPTLAKTYSNIRRKHDDILFIDIPNPESIFHQHANSPGLYPWFIRPSWTNEPPFTSANYLNLTIKIEKNSFKNTQTPLTQYHSLNKTQLQSELKKRKQKTSGNKPTLLKRLLKCHFPFPNYHNKEKILISLPFSKKQNFPIHIRHLANSFPNFNSNLPLHVLKGTVTGHLYTIHRTTSHKAQHFTNAVSTFVNHLTKNNAYPQKLVLSLVFRFLKIFDTLYRRKPLTLKAMILSNLAKIQTGY